MRKSLPLVACLALAATLVLPAALAARAGSGVAPAGAKASATVATVEAAIRGCVNRQRRAAGLEPLRASRPLGKAARLHARNMANESFFDHTDPQGRGPAERVELFDRGNRLGFIGENIAAGYSSAAIACRGWMNSAGHRANILGAQYTLIGGGFARGGPYGRYYVQVFGRAG